MSVPLATTTVTVRRPDGATSDPYETATASTVASHVRAHISNPRGSERAVGGQSETVDAVLLCDVCDLSHYDLVDDDRTGETWQVVWCRHRVGLGLDHMAAGLRATSGAASG